MVKCKKAAAAFTLAIKQFWLVFGVSKLCSEIKTKFSEISKNLATFLAHRTLNKTVNTN